MAGLAARIEADREGMSPSRHVAGDTLIRRIGVGPLAHYRPAARLSTADSEEHVVLIAVMHVRPNCRRPEPGVGTVGAAAVVAGRADMIVLRVLPDRRSGVDQVRGHVRGQSPQLSLVARGL